MAFSKGLLGHDVAGAHILLQQAHQGAAHVAGLAELARVDGGQRGVAGKGHSHHLDGGGHGVGGEQAGAGALAGAGDALQFPQLVEGDVALGVSAHGLENVLDVHVPAVVLAGHDGAAVHEDAGYVEASQGHHAAGHILVAAGDGDEAVHALAEGDQLDGVGDDLAADEGGLHALGAHGYAVADGDGAELEGHAVGGADALLGAVGEAAQVDVAGGDVAGQVGDSDEGLFHVLMGNAHGHQHGAGRRSLRVVGDFCAAMLGLGWLGHGGHRVISVGKGWGRRTGGGTCSVVQPGLVGNACRAIIGCGIIRHKAARPVLIGKRLGPASLFAASRPGRVIPLSAQPNGAGGYDEGYRVLHL